MFFSHGGDWRRASYVFVGQVVKTAVVCRSVGSSSQIQYSQRSLRVLIFCVDFLYLRPPKIL